VLKFLQPFKARLEAMTVESTFNWYWLVDGLQAAGSGLLIPPLDLLARGKPLVPN